MRVTILSTPDIHFEAFDRVGLPVESYSAESLMEFAGRACYQSFSRPNPETSSAATYLKNIMEQKHFSVVEHASITFYIEDVSRSLTHELVRHRHFSFSQLSQRYVDMSDAKPVIPPAIRDREHLVGVVEDEFEAAKAVYESLVRELELDGLPRKQAREAARAVLPNCTPTSIVVSGNMRSWLEFCEKRNNEHADAEIHELAEEIEHLLAQFLSPTLFG